MKKKIMEKILKRIEKNAERGAGRASERGIFEAPVPKKLSKREDKKS